MYRKTFLLLIFSTLLVAQPEDCYSGRYLDEIFDVVVEYEVQYGQNTNETVAA